MGDARGGEVVSSVGRGPRTILLVIPRGGSTLRPSSFHGAASYESTAVPPLTPSSFSSPLTRLLHSPAAAAMSHVVVVCNARRVNVKVTPALALSDVLSL